MLVGAKASSVNLVVGSTAEEMERTAMLGMAEKMSSMDRVVRGGHGGGRADNGENDPVVMMRTGIGDEDVEGGIDR